MVLKRCGCWVGLLLVLTAGCTRRDTPGAGATSPAGKGPVTSGPASTPGKDTSAGPVTTSGKDSGKPPGPDQSLVVKKWRYSIPGVAYVRDFALSPSGTLLAWADNTKFHLWDVEANKRKAEQSADGLLFDAVAFSPDGKTVALASGNGPIKLWDVETLQVKTLKGHPNNVSAVAFVAGDRLVSGAFDKSIKIWDLAAGNEVKTISLPNHVIQMACSADGRLAALLLYNADVAKLWDLETGKESPKKLPADTKATGVALSPDGKTLALSTPAGEVLLWDLEAGSLRKKLAGDKNIYMMRFSGDGKTLAWADYSSMRVWDAATGAPRAVIPRSDIRIALSGDGKVLASAGSQSIAVWDVPPAK
jgi:WD40 repeat protein